MYTRENSKPLVECSVRRLMRSGATSIPSDVESATRSNRRSILSLSVPPLHVVERGNAQRENRSPVGSRGTLHVRGDRGRARSHQPPHAAFDQGLGVLARVHRGSGGLPDSRAARGEGESAGGDPGGAAPLVRGDDADAGAAGADAGRAAVRDGSGGVELPRGNGVAGGRGGSGVRQIMKELTRWRATATPPLARRSNHRARRARRR